MPVVNDPGLVWLLRDGDPAITRLARRDLLGEDVAPDGALTSPLVQGLLTDPTPPGGHRPHPYGKWTGAHWRLVSLVELGVPAGHGPVLALADEVLDCWAQPRRLADVPVVDGRARRCASQEGNAVATACRLGLHDDPRVRTLVRHLVAWQWPDGGWNCDKNPAASHSSFHESLPPLWGLAEYADATGDPEARRAADTAAELLLAHDVAYRRTTGEPIHPSFLEPHAPPYWHYDALQALLVLGRAGHGDDPRTDRVRDVLARRRRRDGHWTAARRWWRAPGSSGSNVEAVDWTGAADQLVTLTMLRVGADREVRTG
jgi:hypothetical protein